MQLKQLDIKYINVKKIRAGVLLGVDPHKLGVVDESFSDLPYKFFNVKILVSFERSVF